MSELEFQMLLGSIGEISDDAGIVVQKALPVYEEPASLEAIMMLGRLGVDTEPIPGVPLKKSFG